MPEEKTGKVPENENPFEAAVAAAKEKKADEIKSGLNDKLPVFVYGKANEEIVDPSITFDKLRFEKSEDFPELDDASAVKWKVEYGGVIKVISDPKKTTVASIKKDIENSKSFTDALAKKKKEDNVVCKVTPSVTAKKKGVIHGYKAACTQHKRTRQSAMFPPMTETCTRCAIQMPAFLLPGQIEQAYIKGLEPDLSRF